MKRAVIHIVLLALCMATAKAQYNPVTNRNGMDNRGLNNNQIDPQSLPDNLNDSVEVISLAPKLYQWRVSETLGNQIPTAVDTVALNFQNNNLIDGSVGHYNSLDNMGSPRLSRIFADRQNDGNAHTIFLQPFSSFLFNTGQMLFTNSNIPYTNLSYWKAGNQVMGEERFKSYLSMNANKRFSIGFNIDYQYGRGYYSNQSTAHFNGGIFAAYTGKHYQMHAMYNNFYLKQNENGGITDDRYITHPEDMAAGGKQYESNNIPVNLEATSNRNHHFNIYLTHRYRMGFNREVQRVQKNDTGGNDTLNMTEFVPVTSLIHTFKIERSRHNFHTADATSPLFPTPLLGKGGANDSTLAVSVRNVLGISLLEGFNKYAKAGLTAYVSHKVSKYTLMDMSYEEGSTATPVKYTEHEVYLGGELAKREGQWLHYALSGEWGMGGVASGQYQLEAEGDLNLPLGSDTLTLRGRAYVKHLLPSFYMRHYHSAYHAWDYDNMAKQTNTRVEGALTYPRTGTSLRGGLEIIKNYTYFNSAGNPAQSGGNIKVANLILAQKFKAGIFHLENEVAWQKTSSPAALPLPTWSLYHNLYLLTKIAKKVLTVQIGADVRYFSRYAAPAYSPEIQQFRLQKNDELVEVGGYPVVNVYANLHLKRTRFFAMMTHINEGMGSRNYFAVPHYPLAPRAFRFGLSWNFYD